MTDSERDPAVLTKAQRRYLLGEELSEGQERAIRARIRERVRAAILDLRLVIEAAEPRDLRRALGGPSNRAPGGLDEPDDRKPGARLEVADSFDDVVGVALLGAWPTPGDRPDDLTKRVFANIVEDAIPVALNKGGIVVEDVTVDIQIETPEDPGVLTEELEEQPYRVLRQLFENGEITKAEFADALRAQAESPTDPDRPSHRHREEEMWKRVRMRAGGEDEDDDEE